MGLAYRNIEGLCFSQMEKIESQMQSVKMLHPLAEAELRKQYINPCNLKCKFYTVRR